MRAGRRQVLEAIPQQSLPGIAILRYQFPETHPFFGAEHAPFLRRRLEAAEPVVLAGLSEGNDGAISVDPGALQRIWDTVKELFDYELGGDWGGSALGADALQHLFETAVNEFRPHRLVYDVGAGCGFVVFALRVLGITAGGCEASTTLRDAANRIGSRYFGSVWEPIEATMRPVSSKVIVYVNNLAPNTQQLLDGTDIRIMATASIPELGSTLRRWTVGDVFTLTEWETEGSCGETTFRWHRYIPVPLEQLFALRKPYPRENGSRSLEMIMFGCDDERRRHHYENTEGKCTWEQCKSTRLFNGNLYARLSAHVIRGVGGRRRFEVRNAFKAAFSRTEPSHNQMVAWMIDWCSVRATGQGFLDVDGPSVAALGGSFSLPTRDLAQHGIVPFRRTGHPEVEKAGGAPASSDSIANDECWRLQVANAAGKDLITKELLHATNPDLADGEYPQLKHVARTLERCSPLLLDPHPELSESLMAVLLQPSGMFLMETEWPGLELGHTLLYDAERKFLCMGRTRRLSHEQHTVNPVTGDLCDPIGRLREQYGFEFAVKGVYMVMLKTRRMGELPLTAYLPPALTEAQVRKEAKRKAYFEQQMQKRVRAGEL